jgi:hypothetical protein
LFYKNKSLFTLKLCRLISIIKPNKNHFLAQEDKVGSQKEYSKIEETFSPDAMKVIKDWILEVTKHKK